MTAAVDVSLILRVVERLHVETPRNSLTEQQRDRCVAEIMKPGPPDLGPLAAVRREQSVEKNVGQARGFDLPLAVDHSTLVPEGCRSGLSVCTARLRNAVNSSRGALIQQRSPDRLSRSWTRGYLT